MSSTIMQPQYEDLIARTRELPKYGAERELTQCLLQYIQNGGFAEGEPFLSDQELVTLTGRSRGLIRRSLNKLHESGWIDRRVGAGTFIGRRVTGTRTTNGSRQPLYESGRHEQMAGEKHFRIGIIGQGAHIWSRKDWCIEFFNSLTESLADDPIVLDFIGWQGSHSDQIDKSLYFNAPDLLVCLGPGIAYLNVLGKAKSLGIPTILAGVRNPEFGLPSVYEDGRTAAANGVLYLNSLGHTRIAFVQYYSTAGWWSFDRYQGYLDGLESSGISVGTGMSFWFDNRSVSSDQAGLERRFRSFLEERRPTAILLGCSNVAQDLKDVLFNYNRVPSCEGGLSLILFDSDPLYKLLFNCNPTTIPYPLAELGKGVSRIAKQILNGEENITKDIMIPPGKIVPGDTTAELK